MTHIIYINGPSSSGKSTLTHALQAALPETYLRIGIDRMIGMMPEKLNDWREGIVRNVSNTPPGFSWHFELLPDGTPTHRIVCSQEGMRITDLFHMLAHTIAASGRSLIIDDVALRGSDDVTRWRTTLQEFAVTWVGLTAPVEVLAKREQERGDRALGSSRIQADLVHQGVIYYDHFFDTAQTSTEQMVQKLVTCLTNTRGLFL